MYGYVYLTTNLVNGMKYVGGKKSNRFLGTGYLGSGKELKRAIHEYGRDSFKVELLEECDTLKELNESEVKWIIKFNAAEFEEFYNQVIVAHPHLEGKHHSPETLTKMSESQKGKTHTVSDYMRRRISETHADVSGPNNPMYGRFHSESTKRIISEKRSERQLGTRWVNNGTNEYCAKGDKLNQLNEGYVYGRLPRKRNRNVSRENNPMYGKHHSEETKNLISSTRKGYRWVNNGSDEVYAKG